jgi:hypothetical protein
MIQMVFCDVMVIPDVLDLIIQKEMETHCGNLTVHYIADIIPSIKVCR